MEQGIDPEQEWIVEMYGRGAVSVSSECAQVMEKHLFLVIHSRVEEENSVRLQLYHPRTEPKIVDFQKVRFRVGGLPFWAPKINKYPEPANRAVLKSLSKYSVFGA